MTVSQAVLEAVDKYGRNSNSLMALYPGFEYFESENSGRPGVIAYVDTRYAWVVAAEPFAAPEDQVSLLEEFYRKASKIGKRVLVLPVDKDFAERAEKAGFAALLIGTEPTFVLNRYPPKGSSWSDVIVTAKQLASKGAVVREFKPAEMPAERRELLDGITRNWLGSRKTASLGFLNQVRPWLYPERKKYFTIELGDKVLAFLAAIPFASGQSWYLIDTMRWDDTPPGTTEMLLCQAMKALKDQGAREVTLGVAPLSGIESVESLAVAHPEQHQALYRLFRWIFNNANTFYSFEPLYQYKMKFRPTEARPVFLLYGGPLAKKARLSLKDILSISQAWLPHGILHAAAVGSIRMFLRISPSELIKSQLRPGTVVRSVPPNWTRLFRRCRFSSTMFLAFAAGQLLLMAASGSLAPGIGPVVVQLLSLAVIAGGLEYLAGTSLTTLAFLVPLIFSRASAVLVLDVIARHTPIGAAHTIMGPVLSLGIFGCFGALFWFLKTGRFVGMAMVLAAFWYLFGPAGGNLTAVGVDYAIAAGLGVLLGKIALRA